jgi:hypothetical protein
MSQNLQKSTSNLVSVSADFPKTRAFFDWWLYVIKRSEEVLWQTKYLLFGLGFALFLIYELAHFAKFLLKNWNG